MSSGKVIVARRIRAREHQLVKLVRVGDAWVLNPHLGPGWTHDVTHRSRRSSSRVKAVETEQRGDVVRVFVAGATGVLGRRVVPRLVAGGHKVTAVARGPQRAAALHAQAATPVAVDLFDPAAVMAAVEGCEAVVNLATAIPPMSRMLRRSAWRPNDRLRIDAARHLVDGALATGATRYVQEALGFVYTDHGAEWIDEEARLDAPRYAAAVLAAEAEARRFSAAGVAGVALRFGWFYSADSPQTRDLVSVARKGLLPLPGRAEGYQSWVHVDDAAAAVVAALDVPAGVYNVVEDDPVSNAAHAEVLGALVGRRVRRPPAWLGLAGPLQLAARSQRVSNARLRDAGGWRPAFPSRREGWAAVLAEIAEVPTYA
jgi:nucleoside-diphosphate-sugar epimerase